MRSYIEELQATDDADFLTEMVTALIRVPLSVETNQFVTVRVWLKSTQP